MRVLGPSLHVGLDGEEVLLGRKQSLLLIALVLSHPAPLLVEDASELLWPGAPISATRLNSVVHRLRDKLGASRGTIVRTGRLLRLDPARCTVDLWEHRRKLAASMPDVRQALRKVPGNLVTTELRHHDLVASHRDRFRNEWLRHARTLVAGGHVRPAELYDAAGRLGIDVADLDVT